MYVRVYQELITCPYNFLVTFLTLPWLCWLPLRYLLSPYISNSSMAVLVDPEVSTTSSHF